MCGRQVCARTAQQVQFLHLPSSQVWWFIPVVSQVLGNLLRGPVGFCSILEILSFHSIYVSSETFSFLGFTQDCWQLFSVPMALSQLDTLFVIGGKYFTLFLRRIYLFQKHKAVFCLYFVASSNYLLEKCWKCKPGYTRNRSAFVWCYSLEWKAREEVSEK